MTTKRLEGHGGTIRGMGTSRFRMIFIAFVFTMGIKLTAQPTEIDSFVGRDFWHQPPSEHEQFRLNDLLGPIPNGFMWKPGLWHVWWMNSHGLSRYVILLGEQLTTIPGGSSACLELFDSGGTRTSGWSFKTGWRIKLVDASLGFSPAVGTNLVVLHTTPVINGLDITKEYFAIEDDRLRLVRLENSKGVAVQNEYFLPNYEIGVVPSTQGVEDWIRLLQSMDISDVLSALVFLGGRHFDNDQNQGRYAMLFLDLLANTSIQGSIAQLTRSGNAWIRDAAILAARDPHLRRLWQ